MSGELIDTDVLIDHLRGHRRLVISGPVAISVITRAELYAGHEREEGPIEALLDEFEELPVDGAVARRAGRIQRHTGLRIADALIAATALEHSMRLITGNRRHFERVSGLEVHGPKAARQQT